MQIHVPFTQSFNINKQIVEFFQGLNGKIVQNRFFLYEVKNGMQSALKAFASILCQDQ